MVRYIVLVLFMLSSCMLWGRTDSLPLKDTIVSYENPSVLDSVSTRNETKKKGGFMGFVMKVVNFLNDFDTTYVTHDKYNFAAMLSNNNSFQNYRFKATSADNKTQQTLFFQPKPSIKMGPYIGWNSFFLGYTIDVAQPASTFKRTEFTASLYGSMMGCDLMYVKNSGSFKLLRVTGFDKTLSEQVKNTSFSGMKTYTASVNAYYIFNHRHFSYPAAYGQTTIQRKSCGSWMLGFQYTHQKLTFDYKLLPDDLQSSLIEELKFSKIDYYNYTVNVGYAYNWVFARNWLFNISLAPNVGFKRAQGTKFSKTTLSNDFKNLSVDVVGRTGVVWNNNHYFAGFGGVVHMFDYKNSDLSVTNVYYYMNLYFGIFFNLKK